MMLLENPWPALVGGLLIEAGLAVWLIRSGSRSLVTAMVAVAATTAGLVLLERLVVTDREQIEATLDTIAERVVSAQPLSVLDLVSPRATELRSIVRRELAEVTVLEARVLRDLEISIDRQASPATATARFTGRIRAQARSITLGHELALVRFAVHFEYDQGQWLVVQCDWSPARGPGKP